MDKNQVYQMEIERLSSDGNGVGHIDGMVVFVPQTAVGDLADIRIVKVQSSYAYGIIERLIAPSPDRIDNTCASYPQCGGCSFRHISYKAELHAKQGFVQTALRRIGGLDIEASSTVSFGSPDRYRNKVQYPVSQADSGLTIGFYANRSHRIVPAPDCLLQPRLLNDIAHACCRMLNTFGITAYDEASRLGMLRHLFLRHSTLSGQVMLCLVLNGQGFAQEPEFAQQITAMFPEISSVLINVNEKNTNVILGPEFRTIYGDAYLEDRLCGVPVRLSPQSFFQVNTSAAQLLYAEIARMAAPTPKDTLLDLHCGTGTIGLSLAQQCGRVIGVEIVPEAVEDARHNAAQMGLSNCEFIAARASDTVRQLAERGLSIDIAITDPPRKGCDEATLRALVDIAPRRIVMVSCNPASLARDLNFLTASGYTVDEAVPVDLFPRTRHVETVVLMSRVEK